MKGRRTAWAATGAAVLVVGMGAAAGCGSGGGERAGAPPPAARPEDFPPARGKTVSRLLRELGPRGPVLSPSVSQLKPGWNRFGFGLFDLARAQITDAPVALYLARVGANAPVHGPFLARWESLAVKPRFRSRTVAEDPDAARSLYVADVDVPGPGRWQVLGVTRLDNRLVAAAPSGGPVSAVPDGAVPDVGEPAPRVHTPTVAEVGGERAKVDTRVPPGTMHDSDLADVLGRKPVILLFATPALCRSRVCGPVVDIAEQVRAAHEGEDIAWIHQEVYNDNQVEMGYRPPLLRYRLPTEPWLFAIDRHGRIAARIEGAFSARELERAVRAATRG